jgi:hypothetical protein
MALTSQKTVLFTIKVAGKIGRDVTNWIENDSGLGAASDLR